MRSPVVARAVLERTDAGRHNEELRPQLAPNRLGFEAPLRDGATTLNAELEGVVSWSRLEGLSYQAGIQFISPPQALLDLMNSLA